jgi:hypothetical protein
MTWISFLLLFTPSLWAKAPQDVHLAIGETFSVKTTQFERVRIQKKGILQIKDEGHRFLLIGKKLGDTRVTIGKRQWHIQVLHKNKKESLDQLRAWLIGKRGPKIEIQKGTPRIIGRLLKIQDFLELPQHTHTKSEFHVLWQMDSVLLSDVRSYLQNTIQRNNLIRGTLLTTDIWTYQIPPHEKDNQTRYKKILQPYGIQVQVDPHSISQAPVIKIQAYIAHIKKNFLRNWGVQWPTQASASLINASAVNLDTLTATLQALEEQGQGKTLATPTLITESGKMAEFHSGGEFPIRTTTQFNNNVQWKRYGLFLKTKPIANSRGHLNIEIELELSALDRTQATADVPALNRSQVKTQINMKTPQPILLSGFMQSSEGDSQSGLPWLQQIPLFSPLFSTGQIYRDDFELVFILIPSFYDQ